MHRPRFTVLFVALFTFAAVLAAGQPGGVGQAAVVFPSIVLLPVATGFNSPTAIANAGDDRLFVAEQQGSIHFIRNGERIGTPFLEIRDRVACCDERGLLGLAFPPGYAAKQWFYVYYTTDNGDIVISRFRATANPDIADPNSEVPILTIPHPTFANHNGGPIVFGPDGALYIGVGDGGGGGDPANNSQNLSTLLGKILRIDPESVAPGGTYTVPPDNPYVGQPGNRSEIWAAGVRNPWRISFDRATGELYIADVGQGKWEEINVAPGNLGGLNYGWRLYEGNECYNGPCDPTGLTMPVVTYPHCLNCDNGGFSITGGYVYRGSAQPALTGFYFYGDYVNGNLFTTKRDGASWPAQRVLNSGIRISTFGEDSNGELFVAGHLNGIIYRISDGLRGAVFPIIAVGRNLAP